jgi:hypothetical protein
MESLLKLLILINKCFFTSNSENSNIIKNFITKNVYLLDIYQLKYYKNFKNFSFLSNFYNNLVFKVAVFNFFGLL